MSLIQPKPTPGVTPVRVHGPIVPGSSYAQPFELLAACHERVVRSLALLARLVEHLRQQGPDASAASAARDVLRYFDLAAPQHHEDEERHVFPALEGDAALRATCQRLRAQHQAMDQAWQVLRISLQGIEQGLPAPDPGHWDQVAQQARSFSALYDEHLQLEDSLVFPAAQERLDAHAQAAMGREMAQRRGLTL